MPQFVRKIFFGVSFVSMCRSQTYPLSWHIFCAGKYHHMTFVDVRRSLCKNMTERRCVDLLYYLRKYSHILAHNDNIMTNTKLHILAIVTCAYICCLLDFHSSPCVRIIIVQTQLARNRRYRQRLKTSPGGVLP